MCLRAVCVREGCVGVYGVLVRVRLLPHWVATDGARVVGAEPGSDAVDVEGVDARQRLQGLLIRHILGCLC